LTVTTDTTPVLLAAEVQPYFDGAREGRLLVKRCRACQRHHHYPRSICPHCFSDDTEWTQASGRGVIYSFSTWTGADGRAQVLAYVTLPDCQVTMLTSIRTDAPASLRVGDTLQVWFGLGDNGMVVPMFEPSRPTP
jgi:uncharacterized OB-fold protein